MTSLLAGVPFLSTFPERPVYHPIVDRLLHLKRPDRQRWLADTRAAVSRFPALDEADREALVRRLTFRDAWHRVFFRLECRFPSAAGTLARAVPIAGDARAFATAPASRPIIFSVLHFGPIHFAILAARRLFRGRRAYVLHAGGDGGHATANLFGIAGIEPVVTGPGAVENLLEAARRDPRCIIIVCFDHLHGRRRETVPFLGDRQSVPVGIGYLADAIDAVVITAWWERVALWGRVRVGRTFAGDRSLETDDRRDGIVREAFAILETRVLADPAEWTKWHMCATVTP